MSNSRKAWTLSCHTLFPTALFAFKLEDHVALNQQLLTLIYQLKQSDAGTIASNVLGWHSRVNLFDLPETAPLTQIINDAVLEVAATVGFTGVKIAPANCWANVNAKYASNKIHDHANCLLSGVYYVKTPPNCGSLMFYDPRSAKSFYKPKVANYTMYTADAIAHEAEAGLLLVFPSWLKHGVEPNLSEDDRVSISFNYVFV